MRKISYNIVTLSFLFIVLGGIAYRLFEAPREVTFITEKVEDLYRWVPSYPDNQIIKIEGYDNKFSAREFKHLKLQHLIQEGEFVPMETLFRDMGKHMADKRFLGSETTDMISFSYDRPLQLQALLESAEKYVHGVRKHHVIYRSSDERFEKAYEVVKERFPGVRFLRQKGVKDFKPLVKRAFSTSAKYVIFAVDDIIVTDHINLREGIRAMQRTGAYGFYYRLGKNTDHCYMSNEYQGVPRSIPIEREVHAWQFSTGNADWAYPNTVDMTLFNKKEIAKEFFKAEFTNPSQLEARWAERAPLEKVGLYPERSCIVNIPQNIVAKEFNNRHMDEYSTGELLDIFNKGAKIDIGPLHNITNTSAHMEYDFTFKEWSVTESNR